MWCVRVYTRRLFIEIPLINSTYTRMKYGMIVWYREAETKTIIISKLSNIDCGVYTYIRILRVPVLSFLVQMLVRLQTQTYGIPPEAGTNENPTL